MVMQSADAIVNVVTNDSPVQQCLEFGAGSNNNFCSAIIFHAFDLAGSVQDPPGASNQVDITFNSDIFNGCEESDAGNNVANCDSFIDDLFGPVSQTNDPSVTPVSSNDITIVTDDNLINNCDETGTGDNFAQCINDSGNVIGEDTGFAIIQDNLVDFNTLGLDFEAANTVNIVQGNEMTNDCDENGSGGLGTSAPDQFCINSGKSEPLLSTAITNFIGVVDQGNDIDGNNINSAYTNSFDASQNLVATNDCDEEEDGFNFAVCDNAVFDETSNNIFEVFQDNVATGVDTLGADNVPQNNQISSAQLLNLRNDCDEGRVGNNAAQCQVDIENIVGELDQDNFADIGSGAVGAFISQNNEIDGNDLENIPGISQVATADNDCDEEGFGINDVFCDISDTDNSIAAVEQANSVTIPLVNDILTISQDNIGAFSQVLDLGNDCDETIASSPDNTAECDEATGLDNVIGPLEDGVFQGNAVTASDDSTADQDNNAAVSQQIVADNDCDGSEGNSAFCENNGDDVPFGGEDTNHLTGISQENGAELFNDAFSEQLNDISVDQDVTLLNNCDEKSVGVNNVGTDVSCTNNALNIMGFETDIEVEPISQGNFAGAGVEAPDATVFQSNIGQLSQNLQATNNCSEDGAGTFLEDAFCDNDITNDIFDMDQFNNAPVVGQDFVQTNFMGIGQSQDIKAINDCDESGDGDSNPSCDNDVNNFIGPLDQENNAIGTDVADVTQGNAISSLSQQLVTNNDCDQDGLGDNLAVCENFAENFIEEITQDNFVDQTFDTSDIFQDNNGAFSQVLDVGNDCDETTSVTTSSSNENNEADCFNDDTNNFMGIVFQDNDVGDTGQDSTIDQGNNVAASQSLVADNDCDGSSLNDVFCENDETFNGFGELEAITQHNEAESEDFGIANQLNDATIGQIMVLLNDCDENQDGENIGFC